MADDYDNTQNDRARLFLYPNKFAKSDRHPALTGPGEISRVALRRIVDAAKNSEDDPIKLRVASWERTSKKGTKYTYVTVEPDDKSYQKEDEDVPF
tara:strand:+ start:8043 stop:8330 length:288 start_codon:yes stop_codon:yes gene_type:complete